MLSTLRVDWLRLRVLRPLKYADGTPAINLVRPKKTKIKIRRYVFNQLNYVRWPNLQMVDTIFSEFAELASAVTVPIQHADHPKVRISASSADNGNVRARAWCVWQPKCPIETFFFSRFLATCVLPCECCSLRGY